MKYQRRADLERKARRSLQSRYKIARVARWAHIIKSFLLFAISRGPERTPHVMSFLLLTEGRTFARTMSAFRATPDGQSLLLRRPCFREVYGDLTALESYPCNSLGHAYAKFMRLSGLNPEFYLGKAIEQSFGFINDPESAWFHLRTDANHDLRHVVSGYGPDTLGEVCLLWFRFGQIRHWGIFALALFGILSVIFTYRERVPFALREAYRRGRRARHLDLVPWEDELDRPLSAHRAALGLTRPVYYPASVAPDAYLGMEEYVFPDKLAANAVSGECV